LNELSIETARIFEPVPKPSRYKGAWGGTGCKVRIDLTSPTLWPVSL